MRIHDVNDLPASDATSVTPFLRYVIAVLALGLGLVVGGIAGAYAGAYTFPILFPHSSDGGMGAVIGGAFFGLVTGAIVGGLAVASLFARAPAYDGPRLLVHSLAAVLAVAAIALLEFLASPTGGAAGVVRGVLIGLACAASVAAPTLLRARRSGGDRLAASAGRAIGLGLLGLTAGYAVGAGAALLITGPGNLRIGLCLALAGGYLASEFAMRRAR